MTIYRICYVSRPRVYFTSAPLDKQWGDDWNDAPYQHNAGQPYVMEGHKVFSVEIGGEYITPEDMQGIYSAEQINSGIVPWLTNSNKYGPFFRRPVTHVFAGATWAQFLAACRVAKWTIARPIDAGPIDDAIPEWVNWL